MAEAELTLTLAPERFAVCRLAPDAPIPPLPLERSLLALTLTSDELSLVLPEDSAPEGATIEGGWRALRVSGPLDFGLTGVLASLAQPLADARLSLFAISTFDTDYLLVRDATLSEALAALRAAGHHIG
ncbi:MAG: ACT domain-containing protein [Ktedonobacterales bacterium]